MIDEYKKIDRSKNIKGLSIQSDLILFLINEDLYADRQTYRQTEIQTDRHTDKCKERRTDKQSDRFNPSSNKCGFICRNKILIL